MSCNTCTNSTNIGNSGGNCCNQKAMDVVTPLEEIRNGDQNFCFTEITDEICENLSNDEGIHPSATNSNSDCDDLTALNDLAIGSLHNALMVLDLCDIDAYKCWLDSLLSWQWNVDKALICAICGLWKNIGDIVNVTNNLQKQIDDINKKLPGGFSTLVTKQLWFGVAHAGQNITLSESILNFDKVRVSYNVGGSQYSTDIETVYFKPDSQNVATYSGIDYSGDNEFRACAGLKATNNDMKVLNVVASKASLVWYNLRNDTRDQWYTGTACTGKTGECIISRIEGVKKIDYL